MNALVAKIAVSVLVFAVASGGAAQAAKRVLTLDEAIGFALKKNEDIFVVRESAASATAAVSGARGVYNPVLTLEGAWRQSKVPVNSAFSGAPPGEGAPTLKGFEGIVAVSQYLPTGADVSLHAISSRTTTNGTFDLLSPAYETRVGVQFRQPLLRNRAIDPARLAIRVARADQKRSVAEVQLEVTETIAAVERAYWSLAAARAEIRVRDEAVVLAEKQLAETRSRIENGAVPDTEESQPRAELERRRGELLESREAGARAETDLKILILSDIDTALWADSLAPEVDRNIEIETVDRAAAMEQALVSRPELAVVAAAIERRKAERALARNSTRPGFDAVVSYDRFGISGDGNPAASTIDGSPVVIPPDYRGDWGRSWEMLGDGDFDDVRAALVFSYPIGNDAAQADAAIAKHAQNQAEADLTRARKSVRGDVLNAAASLETAGQRIETARAGREAAEVQLSAEQDRYGAGLSTNFLVLTRQNDLSNARLEEIAAHADYRKARTELARATGALLEERHISLKETTE